MPGGGVRYYYLRCSVLLVRVSVVCLSCQLSVCDSNSLDKCDNHTHLDIPAPKAVHIKKAFQPLRGEGIIHKQIGSRVTPNSASLSWLAESRWGMSSAWYGLLSSLKE